MRRKFQGTMAVRPPTGRVPDIDIQIASLPNSSLFFSHCRNRSYVSVYLIIRAFHKTCNNKILRGRMMTAIE